MMFFDIIALLCFVAAVAAVGIVDYFKHEIPLILNILVFLTGLLRTIKCCFHGHVMYTGTAGRMQAWLMCRASVGEHIAGFFVVSGIMVIVYIISDIIRGESGIGGGDIKFMAAAGLYMGWKQIVSAFVFGCVYACVLEIVLMITRTIQIGKEFAFGPYLVLGIYTALFLCQVLTTLGMSCILI